MSKKILVTGSGGFIFSNFIRKALYNKSDHQFISVDYCKTPNVLNNTYVNKGHKFHIGDVADRHFMNVIFELERPDIVIHGAAESFVDDSIVGVDNFIHSNVAGTQVIIDCCLKWGVEKLIYISSDEVYGQLTDDTQPAWTEDSPLAPRNPYSATKASGEMLVRAANQTHGLPFIITRSSNNYGPRQQTRNLIPKIIKNILTNQPVPIFGRGMQMREWLHVDDNCNAIMMLLERGQNNEIYNISSGHEFTNIEVFQEICNVFQRGYDLVQFVPDRKGHDFRYSIDSSKLRKLGWKPTWKFKHGLSHTCDWYQKNSWFWR